MQKPYQAPRKMRLALSLCSLACLVFPGAAFAQAADNLVVTAPRLSGYWAMTGPNLITLTIGPFSGVRILYSGETDTRDICLMRHLAGGLSATCAVGAEANASGGIDEDHVKLRWWSGPAELRFDGVWDRASTIAGQFSGGLAGVRVTGHIPATLIKVIRPVAGENPAATAAVGEVLADLRQGALSRGRYEPGAMKRVWRAGTWPGVKAVWGQFAYLGEIHVHWQAKQPDMRESVYEMQAGDHLALCRVGQSPRGLVNDFACQEAAGA
jgi:hypothetical protein